jgi:hypothetical protein
MRSISLFLAAVLCATLGAVYADRDGRVEPYAFEASPQEAAVTPGKILPAPRRTVLRQPSMQSQASSLKSSFRSSRQDNDAQEYNKKRVRFFLQEDGDLNILDTYGNEYVSNDEEEEDGAGGYDAPEHLVASPVEERFDLLRRAMRQEYDMPASEDADREDMMQGPSDVQPSLRRMMDQLQERQQPWPSSLGVSASTVPSSIMDYKRRVASRIRTVESKIEYLADMITVQKQERAEAARYNLTRLKLGDYQVQKRKLDARIRLLKEQLERQQDELQYYEEEMVIVQSRLHSALLRSQRASQASF